MSKQKKITLIEGGSIACNKICKAIKDRGLPHNSIWIYISHLVHNLDSDPNLNDKQRQAIIALCDEYLGIIKDLSNQELIHKQGLHLLAEITEIQQTKIGQKVKDEQQFSTELLKAISTNLEKFYATLHCEDPAESIAHFKKKTVTALKTAKDKSTILAIVEDGFNQVGEAVSQSMNTIKNSLDSMLHLESRALLDPLTGIFNRRFFDKELPKIVRTFLEMEGKKPFSLLVLDIDNFKEINDQHGHFVGDFAIQRVAEILQKNCRAGIDSPIRLGGDEFALFLIGAAENVASRKAKAIRKHIAGESFTFTKQDDSGQTLQISFPITLSIGVSELNYDWRDITAKELLGSSLICDPNNVEPHYKLTCKIAESADEALYRAKKQGKNRVCIYEDH